MLRKRYSDPVFVRRAKDAVNHVIRRARFKWPNQSVTKTELSDREAITKLAENKQHVVQQQLAAVIRIEKPNIKSEPVDLYVLTTVHPRVIEPNTGGVAQMLKGSLNKHQKISPYRKVQQNWFVCHASERVIDTEKNNDIQYYVIDRLITSDKLKWVGVPDRSTYHVMPVTVLKVFDDEAATEDAVRMLTSLTNALALADGILHTQEKLLGAILDDDETLANNIVNEHQKMVVDVAPAVKNFVVKMKLLTD